MSKIFEIIKKKGKKCLEIASDAADIIVHIKSKPSPLEYASIGLRVFNSYVKHSNIVKNSHPFHSMKEGEGKWIAYHLGSITEFICSLLLNNFKNEKLTENDSSFYTLIDLDGNYVGIYCEENMKDGIWYKENELPDILLKLNNFVWKTFPSNFVKLSCKPSSEYTSEIDFSLQADLPEIIYPSKAADKIYNRILEFLAKGYNRSVMLLGDPGTGKSAALKYITQKLNLKSLRISVSDMSSIGSYDINVLIKIIKPEVLIIDDFDRLDYPEKFLTELESINKDIKIFMVSVNDTRMLGEAVLRPGRFDDIIDFTVIDPEIHDRLIGNDIPEDIKKRLKKLPIAYISDFQKRRDVLGVQKAIEEVEHLEKRIKDINSND